MIYISLVIIAAYLIFERVKFGIQESVSATAYNAGWNSWLFTIVMMATSILLFYPMITCLSGNFEFLSFLTCGSLMFVGITPRYRTEGGEVHYTAAYIMAGSSQIWVALTNPIVLVWWLLMLIPLLIKKQNNYTWWSEICCIASLYSSLIYWDLELRQII